MAQFRSSEESHEHSLKTLNIIHGYDSFLDSLEAVADMGCGPGLDLDWFARLETRDDPPEPRNYISYAVDKDLRNFNASTKELQNVQLVEGDIENVILPRKIDLMWSHDTFQYVINPLATLRHWNTLMNEDGMLVIILKQTVSTEYNRLVNRGVNYSYYNHNLVNLIYMLAVNGFDCNDAYALKDHNDPWLHIAVYKSSIKPMDPATTSWYHLAEKGLLHVTVENSLNRNGYVKQEDILYPWLDKDWHKFKN
jgi:SAM-dependent methyltransferase